MGEFNSKACLEAAEHSFDECPGIAPDPAESDVEALARAIVADTDEPMWSAVVIAKHLFAAGYLPPAEVARRERAAAEKALRDLGRHLAQMGLSEAAHTAGRRADRVADGTGA